MPKRIDESVVETRCASQAIATVAAAVVAGPGTVATAYLLNQVRKPKQEPKK